MAMTPEELTRLTNLETLVGTLLRVENVPFIENIKRRGSNGIKEDGVTSPTSITQLVRSSDGLSTVNVCKVPDQKLKIVLPTGTVYYLPAFTS